MTNPDELEGLRVLISGAGTGIGAAAAEKIIDRGGRVAVFDIDDALTQATRNKFDMDSCICLTGDTRDTRFIGNVLDAMCDQWGGIDAVVNNVGVDDHDPLLDLSLERWKNIFDTNFFSHLTVANLAVRRMINGGSIVNMSSVLGQSFAPGRGPYCVSKAAVIALTKIQAIEWASKSIRVNAIAPGYVMTERTMQLMESGSFKKEDICKRTPMGRFAETSEIVEGICFLLNPERSSYITGHVLEINGGWTAYGYV